jgi:hypothetical protein
MRIRKAPNYARQSVAVKASLREADGTAERACYEKNAAVIARITTAP